MVEFREPCEVCSKDIPEPEYHAYGGSICEDCQAQVWKRYKSPGCFAISDRPKTPPRRRGRVVRDEDDYDSAEWEHRIDTRTSELDPKQKKPAATSWNGKAATARSPQTDNNHEPSEGDQ